MTDDQLSPTTEDTDFLMSIFEMIGHPTACEFLNPLDVFGAIHNNDNDCITLKLLILLRDYKSKLLKEKEYQDLKDKTTYNPPGQRWAAPSDQQEDMWLLRFHDQDCREAVFTGDSAEKEAWKAWNRYSPSFNINLFRLAEIPKTRTIVQGHGMLESMIHIDWSEFRPQDPDVNLGYCNKCGYSGPVVDGGLHPQRDGNQCNYLISKREPVKEATPEMKLIFLETLVMVCKSQGDKGIHPDALIKGLQNLMTFDIAIDICQMAFERGLIDFNSNSFIIAKEEPYDALT